MGHPTVFEENEKVSTPTEPCRKTGANSLKDRLRESEDEKSGCTRTCKPSPEKNAKQIVPIRSSQDITATVTSKPEDKLSEDNFVRNWMGLQNMKDWSSYCDDYKYILQHFDGLWARAEIPDQNWETVLTSLLNKIIFKHQSVFLSRNKAFWAAAQRKDMRNRVIDRIKFKFFLDFKNDFDLNALGDCLANVVEPRPVLKN